MKLLACIVNVCVALAGAGLAGAVETPSLVLFTNALVDGEGIFLSQVARVSSGTPLPVLKLAASPGFGQSTNLTRQQLSTLLEQTAPELASTNITGAASVRISRRQRSFTEANLVEMLATTLQSEHVKDRGTLEVRLGRPWTTISIPDEAVTLKLVDLPTTGVSPNFIARFELRTAQENLGTWQAAVQAKVLREVYVAKSALKRGDILDSNDLSVERRDLLTLRDSVSELPSTAITYEITEPVQAGMALTSRALRPKPVVQRGQSVDAVIRDGAMTISMKVEALENGAPGQLIRARNLQSRREIRGKVLDEQTILVLL